MELRVVVGLGIQQRKGTGLEAGCHVGGGSEQRGGCVLCPGLSEASLRDSDFNVGPQNGFRSRCGLVTFRY